MRRSTNPKSVASRKKLTEKFQKCWNLNFEDIVIV